jgi:hypothetical protein
MGTPTFKSFEVATAALHTEADYWDDWSDDLSYIATAADGLVLRDTFTDHYDHFIAGYEPLREMIVARCRAGAEEMGGPDGIGAALRWVARQYEDTERRNQSRMLGLRQILDDLGTP